MNVLFPNPKSWKLDVEESGQIVNGSAASYSWYRRHHNLTQMDNIVFIADVKVVNIEWGNHANTIRLLDREDSRQVYETGATGIEALFKGIQDGSIELVNGWFRGVFTFKKQGPAVYLYPWKEEV